MLDGYEHYVTAQGGLLERRSTTSPATRGAESAVLVHEHFIKLDGTLWGCNYRAYPAPCGRGLIAWYKDGPAFLCMCPDRDAIKARIATEHAEASQLQTV